MDPAMKISDESIEEVRRVGEEHREHQRTDKQRRAIRHALLVVYRAGWIAGKVGAGAGDEAASEEAGRAFTDELLEWDVAEDIDEVRRILGLV